MNKQVGIWVDSEKALLVTLDGEDVMLKHLTSDIRRKHRSTGGVRSKQHFWHRSAISGRREQVRRAHEITDFYRTIHEEVERLGSTDPLFILGPSDAKIGLTSYLRDHGWPEGRLQDRESTHSRMSEAQILAIIKEHFGHGAPRKAVNRPGAPQVEL